MLLHVMRISLCAILQSVKFYRNKRNNVMRNRITFCNRKKERKKEREILHGRYLNEFNNNNQK
jgi:hypothetical protein